MRKQKCIIVYKNCHKMKYSNTNLEARQLVLDSVTALFPANVGAYASDFSMYKLKTMDT
jgi:hypothetical protein